MVSEVWPPLERFHPTYISSCHCVSVNARTPSPAAPTKPQDLSVTLLSNSFITVQWVEPANDGGDAAINYAITLQGGPGATTRMLSSLSTTFTGLEAPNTYTVEVVAANCAGSSPPTTRTIPFQGNLHSCVCVPIKAFIPGSWCLLHHTVRQLLTLDMSTLHPV